MMNTKSVSRRHFLGGTAALGGTALLGGFGNRAVASTRLGTHRLASTGDGIFVGARVKDVSWSRATGELGPIAATRLFYPGALPATFNRGGIPNGVRLIVSYKSASSYTASYVRSIPADADVQVCYHHECEGAGDYAGGAATAGAQFVKEFSAQHDAIKAANPAIPVVMIGGSYQYNGGRNSSRGIGGHFLPIKADQFYLDTYQRGGADSSWNPIQPASQDKGVLNFIKEVESLGRRFNGFTEYGRGVGVYGGPVSAADARRRIEVFAADNIWLRGRRGVNAWCYWYTTDMASGDQWRLLDSASQDAWARVSFG